MLYIVPQLIIGLVTLILLIIAVELGYWIGLKSKVKMNQEKITSQNDPISSKLGLPNLQKNLLNGENIGIAPWFLLFVGPKFGIQTSIGSIFYPFRNMHSKQGPPYTSNIMNDVFNLNL